MSATPPSPPKPDNASAPRTKLEVHPALSLSEAERIAYVNVVASVALVDGHVAPREITLVERLGRWLKLPSATISAQSSALEKGRVAEPVKPEQVDRFLQSPALRECLMMDSIVIAFADGKLDGTESKELAALASALRYTREEVSTLAHFVEQVLFKRGAGSPMPLSENFARSLTAAVSPGGWLREG